MTENLLTDLDGNPINGEVPAYLGITPVSRFFDLEPTNKNIAPAAETYWARHKVALQIIKDTGHDIIAVAGNSGRYFLIGAGIATTVAVIGFGSYVVHQHKSEEKE